MSMQLSASFRSLALGATCGLLLASAAAADTPTAETAPIAGPGAQAVERLARLRPDIPVLGVSASPLPGIVAIEISGGTILYATEDGRYLFAGDLYELTETDLVNVAEAGRVDERREAMASVDPASMIIFPATGVRRASINVFTDVDCGYCRKLHLEVPTLNAMGIEVRYLGFPRAGVGSDSYDRIVSAWCAEDPREALTRVKAGEEIPAASCDNRIAEHYGLGQTIGVEGTPAIVLEDGRLLPGYLPADRLAAALGLASSAESGG
ncbi:MAG: DsbC family protein [Pseudomonadales bacterium]